MALDLLFGLGVAVVVMLGLPLLRQAAMCARDRQREESYELGRLEERRP